jgi:O-antigen ligase
MTSSDTAGTLAPRHRFALLLSPSRLLTLSLWLVGCMWVVPFLVPFKNMPIPSFHGEAAAALFGLLAMSALLPFAGRLALPRVAWMPMAFAVLIVLQILLGKLAYHQHGLLGALFLLWAFGLVLLGGLLRRELGLERVAITLAWFLFAGALSSAIIGLAQLLDSYAFLGSFVTPASSDRVWANLAQANHLADYLALGLASAGFLWATGRLRSVYLAPAMSLMIYILALTGSRTPWLYLGTLVVISAVFWVTDRCAVNRRLLLFALAALAALVVIPPVALLLAPVMDAASGAVLQRMLGQTELYEPRPFMWQVAWEIFWKAPVLGVGFRQIAEHYFFATTELSSPRSVGFTDHTHNIVLQVLVEFGLIGLVILLAGALLWAAGWLRQPRTPALWWLLGLTAVLAIHSMLEYPLWYTFFLGIAAVLLGLGEAHTVELRSARPSVLRAAMGGALLLGWLVFVQIFLDYVVLESFLAFRYRYLNAPADVNKRAKETLLEIHRTSLLAPWVELGLARSIEIDRVHLADKLAVNGRAMRAFPIEDVTYRQAMLLALAGLDEAARQQWDRAVITFPDVRMEAVLVLRRRVDDGLSELKPLLEYAEQETKESK